MTSLLIVGGGTAGLAAAVTAQEAGLETTVVEKTDRLGGMLHWSSGHFSGAGSRRQARRGIEDHPDLHYADAWRIGHGHNDPQLLRRAVDTAPDMVDWLEGLGFPFGSDTPALVTGHELYSRPRTYWGGEDPAGGGPPIMQTLLDTLDRSRVTVRTDTTVRRVLVEGTVGEREVRGVEVEASGGRRRLEADHVVLATGGYAADRELVRRMQPRHGEALIGCMEHATGDGHRMLDELGVTLTHGDTYVPTMGMIPDPNRPGHGLRLSDARVIVDPNRRAPWEVWVNRHGERFVAEDTPSPFHREQALRDQPGIEMVVIWDRRVVEAAPPPIGPDWTWDRLLAGQPWLHTAPDVPTLAGRVEIPPEPLQRTLDEYSSPEPDSFGRRHRPVPLQDPPFYAVRVVGGMLLSRGGPAVDELLRPLDEAGAPIRRLHAVGELLGMGKFSGDSFAGGMSVGPALALGRWVTERIADGEAS